MQASHRYYLFQNALEVGEISHLTMSSCLFGQYMSVCGGRPRRRRTRRCSVVGLSVSTPHSTFTTHGGGGHLTVSVQTLLYVCQWLGCLPILPLPTLLVVYRNS